MTAKWEKCARVYFRRDGKQVVISTIHHDSDGFRIMAEGPLSLTSWTDEELGESLQTALDQSSIFTGERTRGNMSYGPALKSSGEPSERSFEVSFIPVDLSGWPTFILIDASATDQKLRLRIELPLQAPAAELARKVTRMFEFLRDRKF